MRNLVIILFYFAIVPILSIDYIIICFVTHKERRIQPYKNICRTYIDFLKNIYFLTNESGTIDVI